MLPGWARVGMEYLLGEGVEAFVLDGVFWLELLS